MQSWKSDVSNRTSQQRPSQYSSTLGGGNRNKNSHKDSLKYGRPDSRTEPRASEDTKQHHRKDDFQRVNEERPGTRHSIREIPDSERIRDGQPYTSTARKQEPSGVNDIGTHRGGHRKSDGNPNYGSQAKRSDGNIEAPRRSRYLIQRNGETPDEAAELPNEERSRSMIPKANRESQSNGRRPSRNHDRHQGTFQRSEKLSSPKTEDENVHSIAKESRKQQMNAPHREQRNRQKIAPQNESQVNERNNYRDQNSSDVPSLLRNDEPPELPDRDYAGRYEAKRGKRNRATVGMSETFDCGKDTPFDCGKERPRRPPADTKPPEARAAAVYRSRQQPKQTQHGKRSNSLESEKENEAELDQIEVSQDDSADEQLRAEISDEIAVHGDYVEEELEEKTPEEHMEPSSVDQIEYQDVRLPEEVSPGIQNITVTRTTTEQQIRTTTLKYTPENNDVTILQNIQQNSVNHNGEQLCLCSNDKEFHLADQNHENEKFEIPEESSRSNENDKFGNAFEEQVSVHGNAYVMGDTSDHKELMKDAGDKAQQNNDIDADEKIRTQKVDSQVEPIKEDYSPEPERPMNAYSRRVHEESEKMRQPSFQRWNAADRATNGPASRTFKVYQMEEPQNSINNKMNLTKTNEKGAWRAAKQHPKTPISPDARIDGQESEQDTAKNHQHNEYPGSQKSSNIVDNQFDTMPLGRESQQKERAPPIILRASNASTQMSSDVVNSLYHKAPNDQSGKIFQRERESEHPLQTQTSKMSQQSRSVVNSEFDYVPQGRGSIKSRQDDRAPSAMNEIMQTDLYNNKMMGKTPPESIMHQSYYGFASDFSYPSPSPQSSESSSRSTRGRAVQNPSQQSSRSSESRSRPQTRADTELVRQGSRQRWDSIPRVDYQHINSIPASDRIPQPVQVQEIPETPKNCDSYSSKSYVMSNADDKLGPAQRHEMAEPADNRDSYSSKSYVTSKAHEAQNQVETQKITEHRDNLERYSSKSYVMTDVYQKRNPIEMQEVPEPVSSVKSINSKRYVRSTDYLRHQELKVVPTETEEISIVEQQQDSERMESEEQGPEIAENLGEDFNQSASRESSRSLTSTAHSIIDRGENFKTAQIVNIQDETPRNRTNSLQEMQQNRKSSHFENINSLDENEANLEADLENNTTEIENDQICIQVGENIEDDYDHIENLNNLEDKQQHAHENVYYHDLHQTNMEKNNYDRIMLQQSKQQKIGNQFHEGNLEKGSYQNSRIEEFSRQQDFLKRQQQEQKENTGFRELLETLKQTPREQAVEHENISQTKNENQNLDEDEIDEFQTVDSEFTEYNGDNFNISERQHFHFSRQEVNGKFEQQQNQGFEKRRNGRLEAEARFDQQDKGYLYNDDDNELDQNQSETNDEDLRTEGLSFEGQKARQFRSHGQKFQHESQLHRQRNHHERHKFHHSSQQHFHRHQQQRNQQFQMKHEKERQREEKETSHNMKNQEVSSAQQRFQFKDSKIAGSSFGATRFSMAEVSPEISDVMPDEYEDPENEAMEGQNSSEQNLDQVPTNFNMVEGDERSPYEVQDLTIDGSSKVVGSGGRPSLESVMQVAGTSDTKYVVKRSEEWLIKASSLTNI